MKRIISLILCVAMLFSYAAFAEEGVSEIVSLYLAMEEAYDEEAYNECGELALEILKQNPYNTPAWFYAGASLYWLGEYETAEGALEEAYNLVPTDGSTIYYLALVKACLGKKAESLEYLKKIIRLSPYDKSFVKIEPDFDILREEPEYKKLMEITVVVGGEHIEADVPPVIVEGRTLLPLRKVFECMGAEVSYDEKNRTAKAKKDGTEIEITIDNKIARVNGEAVELDVPAMIMQGRTMVPVRFAAEALGGDAYWDGENEVVTIIFLAEHGRLKLSDVEEKLLENTIVSAIDGTFPNPWGIMPEYGSFQVYLKDKETLDIFSQLSDSGKREFLRGLAEENYGGILGASAADISVILDGKSYYYGEYNHDESAVSELIYYPNGQEITLCFQLYEDMNYLDLSEYLFEEVTEGSR